MKGLLLKDWYQVRTSMKTMYLTVAFVLVIWVFSTSNAYVFPVSYAAIFLGILPVNLLTGLIYLYPEFAPDTLFGFDGLLPIALVHYLSAVALLLFLLSLLVRLHDRRRMALIAGTFVLVSGAVYYAMMAAWLNLFLAVGLSAPLPKLGGYQQQCEQKCIVTHDFFSASSLMAPI